MRADSSERRRSQTGCQRHPEHKGADHYCGFYTHPLYQEADSRDADRLGKHQDQAIGAVHPPSEVIWNQGQAHGILRNTGHLLTCHGTERNRSQEQRRRGNGGGQPHEQRQTQSSQEQPAKTNALLEPEVDQ